MLLKLIQRWEKLYLGIKFVKRYFKSLGNFNLKVGTSRSILLDEIFFWFSFHDNIALLIKAFLPYFLVFALLTFKNPFEEDDGCLVPMRVWGKGKPMIEKLMEDQNL